MNTARVLRRGAVLRELASLGCTKTQASILTGVSYKTIKRTAVVCKVRMPHGSHRPNRINHIRSLIIRDYGKISGRVMAERYGSSTASVYATISKLRKAGELK